MGMKLMLLLLIGCLSAHGMFGQEPALVADPSGTTGNQVPQGWKVETRQEGGAYLWMASESTLPDAPGLMQLVVPDQPGPPEAFLRVLLDGTVDELKLEYQHIPSQDEGHFLGEGKSQGRPLRIAALVVRDPGKFLFLNLLSATPQDFKRLGQENLLYRMLGQTSPFGMTGTVTPTATPAVSLSGDLNMQDNAIKVALLQQTAPMESFRLHGQWLQVFGMTTDQVYQQLQSGEPFSGSRGQAHWLDLMKDGSYTLSYLYQSTGACLNRAEITERGKWRFTGQHLTLVPDQYAGTLTVCGTSSREQKTRPPVRTFTVGMDVDYHHMILQGNPLEYTISTQMDDQGNNLFLEGFVRQ